MLRYILVLSLCSVVAEYKYQTKWFTVPLDHFGYHRNDTFNIKYLVNDDHWDSSGGPIFIYTGNEGRVEIFAQYTGFMWEIAAEFKAMVVFAEHRYYGSSMPFGDKSLDKEYIGYLTAAQALADFADLVNYLQGDCVYPKYPVIAFGGSYGGMLAAYFRIKYPHLVAGAVAASAPVHMYPGMIPCHLHHKKVTYSFGLVSDKCVENIRNSWSVLRVCLSSRVCSDWLQNQWRLCDPVLTESDVDILIDFLQVMYEGLAMLNYPYPSKFLRSLPAYPIKVICQRLNNNLAGEELLIGIGDVVQIFANYSGSSKCIEYKKGADGSLSVQGWGYQKCTEMVLPRCSTREDMFEESPWNSTRYAEDCRRKYNVSPREGAARVLYGGDQLQAASNIVFSNGLLDPWAIGSILTNVSDTVIAVVMEDVAHHLDFMPSNKLDPLSVKVARNIHKQNIKKWIAEFRLQKKSKSRGRRLLKSY